MLHYKTSLCLGLFVAGLCSVDIVESAEMNTHIRTLASSCVICHGSSPIANTGIPSLIGVDKSYFIQKMQDFRTIAHPQNIMAQHAKGLTDHEVIALAEFYSAMPRGCPAKKKPSFVMTGEPE